jgi:hypothetical protein
MRSANPLCSLFAIYDCFLAGNHAYGVRPTACILRVTISACPQTMDSARGVESAPLPAGYCTVMDSGPKVVDREPESMATTVTECVPRVRDAAGKRSRYPELV